MENYAFTWMDGMESAMGMVFALMQRPIHVLFMDVTERNAGMYAYAKATLWAFAISISIVTTTENHVVFEFSPISFTWWMQRRVTYEFFAFFIKFQLFSEEPELRNCLGYLDKQLPEQCQISKSEEKKCHEWLRKNKNTFQKMLESCLLQR